MMSLLRHVVSFLQAGYYVWKGISFRFLPGDVSFSQVLASPLLWVPESDREGLKTPCHADLVCFYIGLSGLLILYLKSLSRDLALVLNYSHLKPVPQ